MQKRRLAFLSMDDLDGFVADDNLAIAPLADLGWHVDTISWRQACDWRHYEMVILRTTWDYQNDVHAFLNVLERIEESGTELQNTLNVVKWNIEKTYLRELECKGNAIVKTIWGTSLPAISTMRNYFQQLQQEELIIKPVISANADFTFRLRMETLAEIYPELQRIFIENPFMIQPFMPNIIDEGEFSLFYFSGQYSHAILKTPKTGDFRVQEEHGGIITPIKPEQALKEKGNKVLQSIDEKPLYARVDFVRNDIKQFEIMEVELIEPALYFRMDTPSAERFAVAVDRWMA